ncbi:MAG TPA: 30S ribosome-binding factor RbfA [Accumulibacter sp.]|uniref:Ribosome-binding factor A n=2 Tax=Candidatus Accumulibacter TaxID=327159 RepID=A0A080M759_9PROT|nr:MULTISPECIES: 30S ribosome-binding factor RbfA [Candidatus Accumulibacter]KFB77053.1 MAG: Ribosome-binding factor A [Candidatus Accumulibacter cognatus]MBL8399985.1 30S ribosome-binding factor RbfA [Accumulibacter sp.]MBN8518679.1 30S ribosome-binding factor RbfA [Accumulibacter sp.]MBO3710313.1 30S ribosome-binding factor RbfA [Accumulibacter sp.]MCC2866415.1 30S ribosome-binding factor RbfA [Candidatus Accumulibacter phosphatis]
MPSNKGFSRRDRVSEQIRRELAEVIRSELKDPRVGMISLTEVEVSPDYAHAKVYFSSMAGSDTLDSVQAGLQQASGFLRSVLGRRISIHMIPQLHFVFDDSLERGAQISKLISEAAAISDQSEEPDQA